MSLKKDIINNLSDITNEICPEGYEFKRSGDKVIFFKLSDEIGGIPIVSEAISIDEKLHVKLFLLGSPIPLPLWFRNGKTKCMATRKSVIQNFPPYIRHFAEQKTNKQKNSDLILKEQLRIRYKTPDAGP